MCVCLGYIEYKVKIYEVVHLEENPDFPCRKYSSAGDYDTCLEAEYVRQTVDLMGCAPPWMTDNQAEWSTLIGPDPRDTELLLVDTGVLGSMP